MALETKAITLRPVADKPGYYKFMDLPDAFPLLPGTAATLLRDIAVEEAASLFYNFIGKDLTEDLVMRILEAYVPMKVQLRQEEVWRSQYQRNKAGFGYQPAGCWAGWIQALMGVKIGVLTAPWRDRLQESKVGADG